MSVQLKFICLTHVHTRYVVNPNSILMANFTHFPMRALAIMCSLNRYGSGDKSNFIWLLRNELFNEYDKLYFPFSCFCAMCCMRTSFSEGIELNSIFVSNPFISSVSAIFQLHLRLFRVFSLVAAVVVFVFFSFRLFGAVHMCVVFMHSSSVSFSFYMQMKWFSGSLLLKSD